MGKVRFAVFTSALSHHGQRLRVSLGLRASLAAGAGALIVGSLAVATPVTTSAQAAAGATPLGSATAVQGSSISRALQTTSASAMQARFNVPARPTSGQQMPNLHRGRATTSAGTRSGGHAVPTVSCAPASAGCDTITPASGITTNPYGLAATANDGLYGFDIEPPDQALCAGNGYVMEGINIGEVRVYSASLAPKTSDISLDALMGLTGLGWSSAGDPMCQYDADNGGHWFVTEIVSTTPESAGGAFAKHACFFGGTDACREGIAVSTTADPTNTSWNVYFVDPNIVSPHDPGAGHLLNDYAKTATTRDAFLMFYDEFNLSGKVPKGPCPGTYGCFAFNGAQQLAIQKNALELGYTSANVVHENMGTDPGIQPPDGSCFKGRTAGLTCWFQVIPASSPTSGDFNNNEGGSGFMVATTDFQAFEIPPLPASSGDNRAAVFYWTGLAALNSYHCGACGSIGFGGTLFTGLEHYVDNGQACPAASGNLICGLAAQKHGTLDLGRHCNLVGATQPCKEQGLATNGDGATQASYSGGQIWFAVSTLVNETFGASSERHVGAAYFNVSAASFSGSHPALSFMSQGYVAAAHEDIEFPAMAGNPSGQALMSFSLSGNGGPTGADGGGYFPSSAYGMVSTGSSGLQGATIDVADLGKAPQDGFSEYQPYPNPPYNIRPRWGDYGEAVYVPGRGFYFATEYIQYPNCNPTYWYKTDPSCGGTRDPFANFGTSLNLVP